MTAPKQEAKKVIDSLPEDTSYDEILKELAFDRMIQKGLKVYGVDNAEMADIVTSNSLFHHLKAPMQKIRDENIPRPCEVLVSDVNVMPSLILAQLKRFMSLRPGIKHVFYTLKIGDKISIKEVLSHVNTFKKFGFKEIIATQLPSNKSEILLYGKK